MEILLHIGYLNIKYDQYCLSGLHALWFCSLWIAQCMKQVLKIAQCSAVKLGLTKEGRWTFRWMQDYKPNTFDGFPLSHAGVTMRQLDTPDVYIYKYSYSYNSLGVKVSSSSAVPTPALSPSHPVIPGQKQSQQLPGSGGRCHLLPLRARACCWREVSQKVKLWYVFVEMSPRASSHNNLQSKMAAASHRREFRDIIKAL